MYLNEFANLSKDFTGLDGIIWVDEEKLILNGGHFKRLKVYLDNSKSTHLSYSLITCKCVDKNIGSLKKSDLPKDENEIIRFIQSNQQALLDLSDGIITLDEFKKYKFK